MQLPITGDKKIYRKHAASFVKHAVGTLAVYDSTKRYDFKPQKEENGRVYYWQSVLEEYRERRLKPKT
ncbi:hypothetical protein A3860_33795 [Niastella vici]|uniref:Uncharacterized protein n=1 Tax=Niastella vici TaxID=1703345 RepID=A0A1V9FPR8_9BACT|nr:hypothetical protein [Niastella vici]OQP60355.1 hypothetical protein A3860_33795 [Niastella vici]